MTPKHISLRTSFRSSRKPASEKSFGGISANETDSILASMERVHQAQNRAISELSASVRTLASRLDERELKECGRVVNDKEDWDNTDEESIEDRRASFRNMKTSGNSKPTDCSTGKAVQWNAQAKEAEEEEEDIKAEVELDRVGIRLDGIEVYAVVSALTLATAVASFEMIDASHWAEYLYQWNVYRLLIIVLNMLCGSVGIAAGLHSVIVFSLSLMYGRTAVGLTHDEAYDEFFTKTALQRVRGFRSFLISMYAFMVQTVILVESRCPALVQPIVLGLTFWMLKEIHEDTQAIIKGAECIFQPAKVKKGKRKVGDVAMRGTSMKVLTSSSRNLMAALAKKD